MFKVSGLDKLQRDLKSLQSKVRQLDGTHHVPVSSLLTPAFLQQCSRFTSVEDMYSGSGFKIDSTEDFKAIPDEEWNEFIRLNTSYPNWKKMLDDAAGIWTKKQLGL